MTSDTSTTKPIEGKVARIINARELAINIGRAHGVKINMKFMVLANEVTEIRDPESGTLLGSLDRDKVRIIATEVNDRFTICRTYRTRYFPGGPLSVPALSGISNFLELSAPPRQEVETLRADEKSFPEPLSEEDSYVKIGDRVKQLLQDDD